MGNPKPRLRYPGFQGLNADARNIEEIDTKAVPVIIVQDISSIAPVSGQPAPPGGAGTSAAVAPLPAGIDPSVLWVPGVWMPYNPSAVLNADVHQNFEVPAGWLMRVKEIAVWFGTSGSLNTAAIQYRLNLAVVDLAHMSKSIGDRNVIDARGWEWLQSSVPLLSSHFYSTLFQTRGPELKDQRWNHYLEAIASPTETSLYSPIVIPEFNLMPTGGVGFDIYAGPNPVNFWFKVIYESYYLS